MAVQRSTVTERLLEKLDVVRKRIQQIRERKEIIGEQNTKAALIDPILGALGWDLQEIDEVRREYKRKSQDNPVDYALFLNRTECLFVEAKSLEKDLSDRKWVSQNLSYATVVGVQWCVLTNGDEYRIYNSHAAVDVDEKLFRSVRVSAAETKFLTDTLVLLSKEMMRGSLLDEMWKAHFVDKNVRTALESLLSDQDGSLARLIQKRATALTPADIRASLKRAQVRIDFPVPSVSPEPVPVDPGGGETGQHKGEAARSEAGKRAWETMRAMADATLQNLIEAGLVQPPFELERDYKGRHVAAVIQPSGKVAFGGEVYDSLSTAGGMARKSVIGAPPGRPYPQTNGWTFWQYRDASGALHQMDELRQKHVRRVSAATA